MTTTTITAAQETIALLSAKTQNSASNGIVAQDVDTAPAIGRDPYPLSLAGLALSPAMKALADRYIAAFRCDDAEHDGDPWNAIALDIATFTPSVPADSAAKLMLGLHYLHPASIDGVLAIDTEHFECDAAGEILIASMNELVASAALLSAAPTFSAWDAARLRFERAEAAMEACPMEPSEPFDLVAEQEFERRMVLFSTPAPTAAELAYKLTLYNRLSARHLVRAPEIGAALEADAKRLAAIGRIPSSDQWARAVVAFDAANAAVNAGGLADEQVDQLAVEESDAGRAVVTLSSRTIADVAAKLRIQMKLAVMIEHDDLGEILADLDRLHRETIQIEPENPDLVDAFTTFCNAFGKLKAEAPGTPDEVIENDHYRRMDLADVVLKSTAAHTSAGVAMKLKRAFAGIIGEAWSDHAVFHNRPPEFAAGVEKSDLYQEMFWRAIEDLERISAREVRAIAAGGS